MKRILVCNVAEKIAEHGIHCLPFSYTNGRHRIDTITTMELKMVSINFTMTLQTDFFKDKLQIFSNKLFFPSHFIPCLNCVTFIYSHAKLDVNATVEANAVLLNSHIHL